MEGRASTAQTRWAGILLGLLTSAAALLGCSDQGAEQPPCYSVSSLKAAPDKIVVDGTSLILQTFLWRDFMPISPPDGKPLTAVVYVTVADAGPLPSSISVDALWVVNGNQTWAAWLLDDPGERRADRITKIASNGPKWGPGVYVDVVVRVFDAAHNAFLLRAPNQWIGRTD
jgi:hypothetical protein